jgi:PAS domain S-box-containing protein
MPNELRRWLNDLPIHDPIERRQATLVQVVLLGLTSILLFSALLTLVALPFTTGAIAAANFRNSVSNVRGVLLVLAPLLLLRRGYFRTAIVILMVELLLLAFSTFSTMGLERGWIGALEIALPMSLAALALGRRWLLVIYAVSVAGVAAIAFAWYPLVGVPQNAPSSSIAFALIAGLLALFLDRFGTTFRESLAALRESEERFRALIENSTDAVALFGSDGTILYGSPSTTQILGYSLDIFVGRNAFEFIYPEDQAFVRERLTLALQQPGIPIDVHARVLHQDGQLRHLEGVLTNLLHEPAVRAIVNNYRDITERQYAEAQIRERTAELIQANAELMHANTQLHTEIAERKRLEAQLLHAQKMESIGHLAGGIAHDFNNMLSAIIGFLGTAQEQLPQEHPVQRDLQVAEGSAWRAAALTRQLLVFARKQIVEPHVLSLNEVIVEMDKLLRRLIGEDIELITLPADDLGQIKADPSQIEQVIVNLVVNARDAMPQGGRLTIETANTILDAGYARQHVGAVPGDYVMLAVSDTGYGMDKEVQQHIFEPFYTTKEVGKGTGLGLATCYGIVKQHGGNIWLYSEVGHGTTFKVYLPRVYEATENLVGHVDDTPVPRGTETVLLVEDEPLVREIARHLLHEQGYTVLDAGNGDEALRIIQEYAGAPIMLLVTDVVMPQIGGKALAEQVSSVYPNIKVLFISGYATDAIVHHGRLDPGTNFLSKPFTPAAFARKVREVLDERAPSTMTAMN